MKLLTQIFCDCTLYPSIVSAGICSHWVFFTMHTTFSFLEYVTMWAIVRAVNAIVLRDTVVKCVNATTGTVLITTEAYVAVSHLQL